MRSAADIVGAPTELRCEIVGSTHECFERRFSGVRHGSQLALIRWAGFAAAVGGALVAVKGIAIVVTGDQPEYIFEVAPLFLALGVVGLHPRLGGRGGRLARVGGALAWAGVALAGVSAAVYVATTDDEAFPLSATMPLTALSIFVGLVLLGIAVRRADALPGRWRSLPLAIVAGLPPMIVVGEVLEAPSERLLEIPLAVLGLAWIALGYAIRHAPRLSRGTGPDANLSASQRRPPRGPAAASEHVPRLSLCAERSSDWRVRRDFSLLVKMRECGGEARWNAA